jgi:hypothetical protein
MSVLLKNKRNDSFFQKQRKQKKKKKKKKTCNTFFQTKTKAKQKKILIKNFKKRKKRKMSTSRHRLPPIFAVSQTRDCVMRKISQHSNNIEQKKSISKKITKKFFKKESKIKQYRHKREHTSQSHMSTS